MMRLDTGGGALAIFVVLTALIFGGIWLLTYIGTFWFVLVVSAILAGMFIWNHGNFSKRNTWR